MGALRALRGHVQGAGAPGKLLHRHMQYTRSTTNFRPLQYRIYESCFIFYYSRGLRLQVKTIYGPSAAARTGFGAGRFDHGCLTSDGNHVLVGQKCSIADLAQVRSKVQPICVERYTIMVILGRSSRRRIAYKYFYNKS